MINDIIIRKLIFDLEIKNEKKYFPISNQISLNINDSFLKQLDNIFSKFNDNYYRINSLEINIGDLNFNDLADLERIIIDQINSYLESNLIKFDIKSRTIDELLLNYSINGYLPWWVSNKKKVNTFIKNKFKENDAILIHNVLTRDFDSFKRIKQILTKTNFELFLKAIFKNNFSLFTKGVQLRSLLQKEISKNQFGKNYQEIDNYFIFKTLKNLKKNDKKTLIQDILKKEIIGHDLSSEKIQKILIEKKDVFFENEFEKILIEKKENILKYLISNSSGNENLKKFVSLLLKIREDGSKNNRVFKNKFKTFKDFLISKRFLTIFLKRIFNREQLMLAFSMISLTNTNNKFFLSFLEKNYNKIFKVQDELSNLYRKLPFSELSLKNFNLILRYWVLKFIGVKKNIQISQEFILSLLIEMEKDFTISIKKLKNYMNYTDDNNIKKSLVVFIEKNKFVGLSKSSKEIIFYKDLFFYNLKYDTIPFWSQRSKIERKEIIIFFENILKNNNKKLLEKLYIDFNIRLKILNLINHEFKGLSKKNDELILQKKLFSYYLKFLSLPLWTINSEVEKKEVIFFFKILLKNREYKYLKDVLDYEDTLIKIIPLLENESIIKKLKEEEIININNIQLIEKYKKLNELNEGFFIIENILLRSKFSNLNSLFVYDSDSKRILKNIKPIKNDEINFIKENLIIFLKDKSKYTIIKKNNSYKIVILDSLNNRILMSIKSFKKKDIAESEINHYLKMFQKKVKRSIKKEKINLNFNDLLYYIEFGSIPIIKKKIYEKDFLDIIRNTYKNNFFLLKKYVHVWSINENKILRFIKILENGNNLNIIKSLIHIDLELYLKTFDSLIKKINLNIQKIKISSDLNLMLTGILNEKDKLLSYFLLKIWSKENLMIENPLILIENIINNILQENKIDKKILLRSLEKINNIRKESEKFILKSFIKIVKEDIILKKEKKITENSEEIISNDLEDGVTVFNSGLVLIWPYLYSLFSKLGYISNENYIDDQSKNKAIISTIYLVSGKTKFENENLLLNKILCGIDHDFLINSSIELNEFEIETCNLALKSVINRWEKVKSINDLRRWFLLREGVIKERNDEFNLIVKSQPQDTLIKFIPWGFMMIKSKLMKKRITINWRY